MRLAIVGTGYVGLVSGVCLSDFGHDVVCVDLDAKKIEALRRLEVPIYEPGLEDVMSRNVAAGRLSFTSDLAAAVRQADAIFLAVGTPMRRGDGHADLTFVYAATRDVARALETDSVIVTKSTVPVGTNREIERILREERPDLTCAIASNPEFLREGAAINDFMRPDRVIVGVEDETAQRIMAEVYRPLFLRDFPIVYTGLETAEMIKYASNAFLATKISFINEIAALCEAADANVKDVARGMGLDGRIGNKFLHAGPGFGGSCFPKDTNALVKIGEELGVPMRITRTVLEVNDATKARMVDKIVALCDGSVEGKMLAVLGVTFKPETDDMREAPSLTILPALQEAGADIRVVDPQGRREGLTLLPGVDWRDDPYDAVEGADAVIVLTEWNAFRGLDLRRLSGVMRHAVMADLRNIYSAEDAKACGFARYTSVGRVS